MALRCEKCGATYQQVGDADEGYFRSVCECEATNHCDRCKRGSRNPINQAALDLDKEVMHYLCKDHGFYEAAEFPELALAVKPKKRTTLVEVVEPKGREPEEDPNKLHPRSGMVVEETTFLKMSEVRWATYKKNVKDDLKSKDSKYSVRCSSCKKDRIYGNRKLSIDEENKVIRILCPNCDGPSYTIL